jgi:hypothetical protein
MEVILEAIKNYGVSLSAIGATIAFIWGAFKYLVERRSTHYWREFEVFHTLVKELVEPQNQEKAMYVDRQAAIMFELRNFKRYYPYSLRMLNGLRIKWSAVPNQYPRLIEEIELTIEFLEKHT